MSCRNPVSARLGAAAVVVALALTATGCGDERPDVDDTGAIGPDEAVNEDIKLVQAQLEYPFDGVYEAGEDARLFVGIANDGTTEDDLLDVRGPDFTDATITVDGEPAPIRVLPNDNVYVGAEGAPSIPLEDLQTSLRSSESIPVTFVFEEAGKVTLEAMVAAEGKTPSAPFDFEDPAEDPTP
jgi:copper(I)-binding protein